MIVQKIKLHSRFLKGKSLSTLALLAILLEVPDVEMNINLKRERPSALFSKKKLKVFTHAKNPR